MQCTSTWWPEHSKCQISDHCETLSPLTPKYQTFHESSQACNGFDYNLQVFPTVPWKLTLSSAAKGLNSDSVCIFIYDSHAHLTPQMAWPYFTNKNKLN